MGNNSLATYSLQGNIIITPNKLLKSQSLLINAKKIKKIGNKAKYHINLKNQAYVYPALINIHDHLRGTYLPRVGPKKGSYYLNWAPWDKDLKSSATFRERAELSIKECYLLGAYKNLFSGVTTVNDHFPHEINDHIIPELPIRVIKNYTLAHECSSYDLQWGDGIEIEHERAIKKNYPFITHLEEGWDKESQEGVEVLENLNCLDEYDVLIHCVGFSDRDIKKVKKAKATVVWCPASNIYMYNLTCKIKKMLQANINIALGTDSTATGSVNLLEEMRFARSIYRRMYGEELDARIIVSMVTENPAKAFRMQDKIGTLAEGQLADIIAIKPRFDDPYEALVNANIEDIILLTQDGDPVFASNDFEELFELRKVKSTKIPIKGKKMIVKGDPVALLKKIRETVRYKKVLDFIPLDI